MTYWLRPPTPLVLTLLILAPAAPLGHLMLTWMPRTLAAKRLAESIQSTTRRAEAQLTKLEHLRQRTNQLRSLRQAAGAQKAWLDQRDHFGVSDTLARAFQHGAVQVTRLTFDEPELYAASPQGELLACEKVTVVCRGSYDDLTACLDRLESSGLPLEVTDLGWERHESELELTVQMRVPFAPDAELEATLKQAAGLEVEENAP